jgi:hypothetical protein
MRRVLVSLMALGLFCVLHGNALADDAAARDVPPDPAMEPMKQLQPLVGSFDAKGESFSSDGKSTLKDVGTVTSAFHSNGHVLTMLKSVKRDDGAQYDDTMVFYYSLEDNKIHAILFSLWDNPRQIEVTVGDGSFVLLYDPLKSTPDASVTRETIAVKPDGGLHWLVEHRMPDGSFKKHREIDAAKQ